MRLRDGRTRLSYKAEHVVDMETGAVLAAEIYTANTGDTATISPSLETARANIEIATKSEAKDSSHGSDDDPQPPAATTGSAPASGAEGASSSGSSRRVIEVVGDKGYHKAELLRDLARAQYRTYISVPKANGPYQWVNKGRLYTQQAYYNNRARVTRAKGKALLRRRGEMLERPFAHACETGGHRRTRLRGRENVRKRYLIHVAATNLGLVLRAMLGRGTPRGVAEARKGLLWLLLMLGALVAAVRRIVDRLRAPRGRQPQPAEGSWYVMPSLVAG